MPFNKNCASKVGVNMKNRSPHDPRGRGYLSRRDKLPDEKGTRYKEIAANRKAKKKEDIKKLERENRELTTFFKRLAILEQFTKSSYY